jgi:hypothetical protein
VDVLDATHMGKEYAKGLLNPKQMATAERVHALQQRTRTVQEGIHALTGRDAAAETELRRAILEEAKLDDLAFGLGVHAYGDSFAHRMMNGSGKMYVGPLGHAVHAFECNPDVQMSKVERALSRYPVVGPVVSAKHFVEQCLHDPHEPDFIHKRVDLYREYATSLYDIVRAKVPDKPERLKPDALRAKLDAVSRLTTEEDQIAKLREVVADMGQTLVNYEPEEEGKNGPLTWDAYRQAHPLTPDDDLRKVRELGETWTRRKP